MHTLTTIAAIIGISLLPGTTTVYAQNAVLDELVQATTTEQAPNPFPLTPAPTPTSTAPVATTTATSTPEEEEDSPEPIPIAPVTPTPPPPKKNPPAPKPAPKPVEGNATTTASTTPYMPLAPGTIAPGNIYQNAAHAPLGAETTRGLLIVAALSAVLGSFMVEKRRLEMLASGVSGLFSPLRSLPRPQAERQ